MERPREAIKKKLSRAAQLLLFKRHRYPGARGWELKKYLGSNYKVILDALNRYIEPLGLTIKRIEEEGGVEHYAVIAIEPMPISEARTFGWRIDEMAVLVISLAYILSRGGAASKKEIIELLEEKIVKWRIERSIERFLRFGYLEERDEKLEIGIRSKIEFDLDKLVKLIIGSRAATGSAEEGSSSPPP